MPDNDIRDAVRPEPQRQITVTINVTPPSTFTYANVASVTTSPWDIRIGFADLNPENATAGETNPIPAALGVVMPPELAAALVFLITDQLRTFEAQFGKIRNGKWRRMEERRAAEAKELESDPTSES